MPRHAEHHPLLPRLHRITGQLRGVTRMVEERRYCIDILQQITATRRALDEVALQILKNHTHHCVRKAIQSNGGGQKVNELINAIQRFVK